LHYPPNPKVSSWQPASQHTQLQGCSSTAVVLVSQTRGPCHANSSADQGTPQPAGQCFCCSAVYSMCPSTQARLRTSRQFRYTLHRRTGNSCHVQGQDANEQQQQQQQQSSQQAHIVPWLVLGSSLPCVLHVLADTHPSSTLAVCCVQGARRGSPRGRRLHCGE
jgi:hypothetical protein